MLADEGDERGKADALRRDPVRRILDRLGYMGASGAAHVPYQGAKQLLLAFEIGVEGAEGDAGAGRDSGDRRVVISPLAKFPPPRLQPAAAPLPPPFCPRPPFVGRFSDHI